MDFSKLKLGDWLIGGGAIAFLISLFLPWYKVDFLGFSSSANGLDYGLAGTFSFLLILVVFVLVVLPKLADGIKIPEQMGPLTRIQVALIVAGVATALVLLRVLVKDDGGVDGGEDLIDRGIGIFLATLAVLAVLAGTFLKFSGKEPDSTTPSGPATPF